MVIAIFIIMVPTAPDRVELCSDSAGKALSGSVNQLRPGPTSIQPHALASCCSPNTLAQTQQLNSPHFLLRTIHHRRAQVWHSSRWAKFQGQGACVPLCLLGESIPLLIQGAG